MKLARLGLFTALALAGCVEESAPSPVPGEGGSPPSGLHPEEFPRSPQYPLEKRTIVQRNPFGNVAAAQNLLWDGDFEWSSPFGDQYGWFEPPANPTLSDIVVGAACKSGVKCARLKKNSDVIGIAVGSKTLPLSASLWVRFEGEDNGVAPACDSAQAYLLDAGVFEDGDPEVELLPVAAQPDESGWCQLAGTTPVRKNKPYLVVVNDANVPMLLDDAVLLAVEAPSALPPARPLVAAELTAEERARFSQARAAIAANRHPVTRPGKEAREALERDVAKRGAR